MHALVDPITADIKKIRADVADIPKIKDVIQTIKTNITNLQRDINTIKSQTAKVVTDHSLNF